MVNRMQAATRFGAISQFPSGKAAILNVNKEQRQSSAICSTSVIPAQAGTHGKLRQSRCVNGSTVVNQLGNFFYRTFADDYVGPGLRRDDELYFGILRAVYMMRTAG